MREIKFRAWHSKYGYSSPFGIGGHPEWNDGMTVSYFSSVCQFEQFTGLLDKNGKEIYEGDIDEARGICVWVEEDCRWAWQDIETGDQYGLFAIGGKLNIIGNIHENPELLEVAK